VPAASFTVGSGNTITAVSPPGHSLGPADVRVTTAVGTSAATATDQFRYTGCLVPKLKGKLKASKKLLASADCKLGKVKGPKDKGAKVKKQSPSPGTVLPPGSTVSVKTR
jgi:hypothetical protein